MIQQEPMIEDSESHIVIERTSSRDIKMRDLYLVVDDLPEETLVFGDSLDLPVSPGPHRIRATNRIQTKTIDFDLVAGEIVRISAICIPARSLLAILMMLTGVVPYKVELKKLEPLD